MGEGGQPQFPFLAQIYRNLPGPQITQKLTLDTLEIQFLSHFFVILGHFSHIMAWIGHKELTHGFYMFKEIVTLDIYFW